MTKMGKNTEKEKSNKIITNKTKTKKNKTNIVFLLLAVLVQHLLTH